MRQDRTARRPGARREAGRRLAGRARWRHEQQLIRDVAALNVQPEADGPPDVFAPGMVTEVISVICRELVRLRELADDASTGDRTGTGQRVDGEPPHPLGHHTALIPMDRRHAGVPVAPGRADELDRLLEQVRVSERDRSTIAEARDVLHEEQERLARLEQWLVWLDWHAAHD